MIIVALVEAVCLLTVVGLFLRHISSIEAAYAVRDSLIGDERRELLNRIQRPEFTPVAAAADYQIPEFEPDEIDKVGTVDFISFEDAVDLVGTTE